MPSKSGGQVSHLTPHNHRPISNNPPLWTDTLELITSKENAHSRFIASVGFNNDGTKIVSGSDDKTIKVWDAGVNADTYHSPLNQ